jgi:hypothetical protein
MILDSLTLWHRYATLHARLVPAFTFLEAVQADITLGRHEIDRPKRLGLGLAARAIRDHAPDVVVIAGYMFGFELEALAFCKLRGIPVVMRGEFTDARPEYGQLHRLARKDFLTDVLIDQPLDLVVVRRARRFA